MTGAQELADHPGSRPLVSREVRLHGAKWDVATDTVDLDPQTRVRRDVVVHPGAVGVLALDDAGRVMLVQQYRHPVRATLWELPAGLLDVPGEAPLSCARRELFEEAHLRADRWDVLVDVYASPGMSDEVYRIFLARGVSPVPAAERHVQEAEERDMPTRWVPLGEAVEAVRTGRIRNAMAVVGLLAAHEAVADAWRTLRPATDPWPGAASSTG